MKSAIVSRNAFAAYNVSYISRRIILSCGLSLLLNGCLENAVIQSGFVSVRLCPSLRKTLQYPSHNFFHWSSWSWRCAVRLLRRLHDHAMESDQVYGTASDKQTVHLKSYYPIHTYSVSVLLQGFNFIFFCSTSTITSVGQCFILNVL